MSVLTSSSDGRESISVRSPLIAAEIVRFGRASPIVISITSAESGDPTLLAAFRLLGIVRALNRRPVVRLRKHRATQGQMPGSPVFALIHVLGRVDRQLVVSRN